MCTKAHPHVKQRVCCGGDNYGDWRAIMCAGRVDGNGEDVCVMETFRLWAKLHHQQGLAFFHHQASYISVTFFIFPWMPHLHKIL